MRRGNGRGPRRQLTDGLLALAERLALRHRAPEPLEPARVRKVLAVEAGGVGDLLRVLPALEALRANFPAAALSLLASPAGCQALGLFPRREILDRVLAFDVRGPHRPLAAKLALIRALRREGFDLAYAPLRGEGMRALTMLVYLTGAPHRIGFTCDGVGGLHTIRLPFRRESPILQQNLALLGAAGLAVPTDAIRIAVPPAARLAASRILGGGGGAGGPLVSVHPGAAWRAAYRCWPLERFEALIRLLRSDLGATVLILGDRGEAPGLAALCERIADPRVINTAGRTSLAEMAALVERSQLFVGNDSGPLHIALALGVPSVGIFAATAAEQVLPAGHACVVVEAAAPDLEAYRHEPVPALDRRHAEALARVSPEAVLSAAWQALAGGRSGPCMAGAAAPRDLEGGRR